MSVAVTRCRSAAWAVTWATAWVWAAVPTARPMGTAVSRLHTRRTRATNSRRSELRLSGPEPRVNRRRRGPAGIRFRDTTPLLTGAPDAVGDPPSRRGAGTPTAGVEGTGRPSV